MRAEMTKCEQAQKGIDSLIDKIEDLCEEAMDDALTRQMSDAPPQTGKKKKNTISIDIRTALVQVVRCIRHCAVHLGGFKEEMEDFTRITYREDKEEVTLDEEEQGLDEKRVDEELEVLGAIGFKNAKEPYVKFPEAIVQIDNMCKDLCQKLYQGDNIKYLEGPDKIPAYLSVFLEKMKKQAEEFKISQVRQLRTSAQRLQDLCAEVPKCIYNYIRCRFSALIETRVETGMAKFNHAKAQDKETKDAHLRLFRPNLENPANKQATKELNETEISRLTTYNELIDET